MAGQRVLIVDEIVARPGHVDDVRRLYRANYAPAAERRGMVLQSSWQSPTGPRIDATATTLWFVWSVDGVAGWWRQRLSRRPDGTDERGDKHAFWQSVAPLIITRRRQMLTDQSDQP